MFVVKYVLNFAIEQIKFDDYETAKSWAITNLSANNQKWLIRDLHTGNQYIGDTTIKSLADRGIILYPKVYKQNV